ncbi:MAG TPA: RluA family pseudouridine synthase [Pirellula sp.]|nr:RluA family pseudouridine synthase [Pirellula sp.]
MQILFEDNHLLVLNKPANWVVQGASPGQRSAFDWSAGYLKAKYDKPGKAFIGVVSRLDAPVTGVLPFARTSKAASRLSEQFREHTTRKTYWAIVGRSPTEIFARLEHHLSRREEDFKTRVSAIATADSKLSILDYRCIGRNRLGYELEINLISGRKHQIRAQLEAIGCPIVGDKKYGSNESFAEGIALHCRSLELIHPTLKTGMRFEAEIPEYWQWSGQSS